MAFSVISLSNLTELKTRRGNATSTTLATILGLNYPMVEAYSVYWWDDTSTTTPDDNECVQPSGPTTGRWFKIDLDQVPQANSDWNAVSGITSILNRPILATVATTGSYTDLSNTPTITPQVQVDYNQSNSGAVDFVKNKPDLSIYYLNSNPSGYLTSITSSQISTALGYTPYNGTTNINGYISASSSNNLTNKTGSISQWTNDAGYITSVTSGQITTALGYTPLNPTRTITINSVTQDLSSNRTWTVGDILSTGSYSNPSWITSLAWSKITGTPNTLSGYGITDGVTSSTLSSTLANYVTSVSLASTLSNYVTNASLSTTLGSYVTNASLTTTLGSYVTSSSLTSTLSTYVTSSSLTSTLSGYVTSSTLTSTLSGYATTATLTSGLAGKENTITAGTTSQYWRGDKTFQTLNTTAVVEGTNLYYTDLRARAAITFTTSGTTGLATYNPTTGALNIPNYTNTILADYTNTALTSGTTGNAVFFLTSDKTSTGTALYTNVNSVQPIINDSTLNYSYSWTISADKKTLTVNAKAAVGINVALLSLTLLGTPSNVPANTAINVLVKGS